MDPKAFGKLHLLLIQTTEKVLVSSALQGKRLWGESQQLVESVPQHNAAI